MDSDWREIFAVQPLTPTETHEVGACAANCQQAHDLKCVCQCGGRNHGAALKKQMQRLDQYQSIREMNL